MRTALLLLGAIALCLAAPLHVAAQSQNPYLNAGMRLYADLEYESALEQLKKATAFPGNTPAEDIQISLYRGLIRFELGDPTGAESDFKTSLALDPEVRLPSKSAPKAIAAFEKARGEILKARPPKPLVTVAPPPQTTTPPKVTPPPDVPVKPVQLAVVSSPADPRAVPPAAIDPGTPPKVAPARRTPVLPFVLLGAGAALGGGGVAFGLQSSKSVEDARAATFQSDAVTRYDSAKGQALAANIFYGAAAVAVVVGVITFFTSSGGDEPAEVSAKAEEE